MNIQNLETQYLKWKVAYYEGHPLVSDAVFDVAEKELKALGSKVVEQVGSKRKDFDFPHPHKMLSLAKFQTESVDGVTNYQTEAFSQWLGKRIFTLISIIGATSVKKVDKLFYSPKFDGSAINIIYKNKKLESVLTRGDGKAGKDVTDRFKKYLPPTIADDGVVEIRCEAVMNKNVFEKKYATEFANARNLVAGVIGKDDFDIAKVADITLCPILYIVDGVHQELNRCNIFAKFYPIFEKPYIKAIHPNINEYVNIIKEMEQLREKFEYPLDGIVFSFPVEFHEILGENDHDPNHSVAIKFVPEESVTTIIGIEWNLGKTGELCPVVLVKPVQLAGTTVKRASGYNAGYIIKNHIQPGTVVSLEKRGDIIPAIKNIIFTPE